MKTVFSFWLVSQLSNLTLHLSYPAPASFQSLLHGMITGLYLNRVVLIMKQWFLVKKKLVPKSTLFEIPVLFVSSYYFPKVYYLINRSLIYIP